MNKGNVNNENEFVQQDNLPSMKQPSGSSKKIHNQLYQSASFETMSSSLMNKSAIAQTTSQTQFSSKIFQERLNKSGIYFKNGTLVNITDIELDDNQSNEKDTKIRDLEDREGQLKKQLREVSAKLEKDLAILNQKLEFAELELKEAKQKIKDNDEFFRLFEINDLRYQQHPIFKQKFAQLNEMHNQQIAVKQREIENLRALLRQYNEPTIQSNESLSSVGFSSKKPQKSQQTAYSSSKEDQNRNIIEQEGEENNQTPTKNKSDEQSGEKALFNDQDYAGEGEEKVKRNRNPNQKQQMDKSLSHETQEYQDQLQEEIRVHKERIASLESEVLKYEQLIQQNKQNEQTISDLQLQCKNLNAKMEESVQQMRQSAELQEKVYQEKIKQKDEKISKYESELKMQQQAITQYDQRVQEYQLKCQNLERQQNEIVERIKNEQQIAFQEQLNNIVAEREQNVQEYFEQEYLNKLEFYEKSHTEILEENQRNFEEQLQNKEQEIFQQVQQREQCMVENMELKQLQFDQKIKAYELQLQTKQQELLAQQHAFQAASSKIEEQGKQIEDLRDCMETQTSEQDQLKLESEKQIDKFEKIAYSNDSLQRECEQQHQLIIQLEHEIQQAADKASKVYVSQIQDLESVNKTYQISIKELEQRVATLTNKLNTAQSQPTSNNPSLQSSETKMKKKQKFLPGAIKGYSGAKHVDGGELQQDGRVDESEEESSSSCSSNNNNNLNYNNQQINGQAGDSESNNIDQSNVTMFSATNISYNLGKVNSTTQQQTKLIQQLQSQLQQQQSLFLAEQSKIKQETTQLQSHIKQLEVLLIENREAYYKERNVLETSIQKQKTENKELQSQIQLELKNVEHTGSARLSQLNEVTTKLTLAEEQKKMLQQRLDRLAEEKTNQMESESSSNNLLLQVKNNEINECKIRIEVLSGLLKDQEAVIKKTQGSASILEIEKIELLQQVNFLENQQQQAQEEIVQQYENELSSLSGQLHDQIAEFAEERQRFLDTIETLQQSINFQNEKNQELIEQCEQIEQEEGIYQQQQESIRALEGKLKEQEMFIMERENVFAIEMQKKEKYVQDLMNQIHILEVSRKEMMDEVEQEQERFLTQMQNQRLSQVTQNQNDHLTSKQIILALQQEREYLQKKIEIIESQKDSLRGELNEMTTKLETKEGQEEKVKGTSPNRNFGFVSFKAGSNCVSFAPQALGGVMSSSPSTQGQHRKGNSIHGYGSNKQSNQINSLPCGTSQSQIFPSASSTNIMPSYDNGQYLNTSQFGGGSSTSGYMTNSAIGNNFAQQYSSNGQNAFNNGVNQGNSMAQSSVFSSGQSFIQNNNHLIFGSLNHSSLYGLSQAQMLEIIERAYVDRLQQQQHYFEQKFKKERDDNMKRSKEPTLIAEKKKLQIENDKLSKEVYQLRNQKQLEDEFNSIKGHQVQLLQDTANLCLEKSRSKNRPTRDISASKDNYEADKFRRHASGEKKCFDLNLNRLKSDEKNSNLFKNNQSSSKNQIDLSTNVPNKLMTDGDLKKNKMTVNQTIQSIQTGLQQLGNTSQQQTTLSSKGSSLEAGSIVMQRNSRTRNPINNQVFTSLDNQITLSNQNIQSSISSIGSSSGTGYNVTKQQPLQQSITLSQQNMKTPLQQTTSPTAANTNFTKAYGSKESTLISINSDIMKSNLFNSNNSSSSFLKSSNLCESFLKSNPNPNTSIPSSVKVSQITQSNNILSQFPQRDSTPTTILKKSYINLDSDSTQAAGYSSSQQNPQHNMQQHNLINKSNNSSHISQRMQRSITEQKLFNNAKLNITSQKY